MFKFSFLFAKCRKCHTLLLSEWHVGKCQFRSMSISGRSDNRTRIHANRRYAILHLLHRIHFEFDIVDVGTGGVPSFQASILIQVHFYRAQLSPQHILIIITCNYWPDEKRQRMKKRENNKRFSFSF